MVLGARAADTALLFTYFTRNGEDGLRLAWSEDGLKWHALNEGRSFLAPLIGHKEKLMRDPCIARGPDGTWHMVWTTGWNENGIGYASTRDFINWSPQRELPVMAHEPAVRNTWAPEIAYDEARGEFVIFWASTIPGRFPETAGTSESAYNHRMYCTTTKDFQTCTPTRLFYDPGFSVIDATLLRDGEKQWLIVKDETVTPPKKHLRVAIAAGAQGPFESLGDPFTPPGLWVEGPTVVKMGADYYVYFDAYRDRRYGAMRSLDMKTWEDVSAQLEMPFEGTPERMRHGTVAEVPRALITKLQDATARPERLVRFNAPADHFTQSIPMGNGALGLMFFGGVEEERIILNESGMWSGSPQDADRPDAASALPEIRRLLLAGKNAEAEKLVADNFTCAGPGSGHANGANIPYGSYQVLGDLRLKFSDVALRVSAGTDVRTDPAPHAAGYSRDLDVADAIGRMSYERGGVRYFREAFVSAPNEVAVVRLMADKPQSLSFEIRLDRPERATTTVVGTNELLMSGRLPDGKGGDNTAFAARVRVVNSGGSVTSIEGGLHVDGANEVMLLVTAATDIKSFAGRKVDDAIATTATDLEAAAVKSYSVLRNSHVAHYRSLFDRVGLRLGGTSPETAALPTTGARLVVQSSGESDPGLAQLYFDFGRYLLISSSRPDGLPANLQGIWAESVQTPWNGDWHLNVNVQMNYWPAEVCNLSELHQPLFGLIASLVEPGSRTARKYYGADGWVAHVLANPWGFTSPGEGANWGATSTGSAWLCQHLWEHWLFTGDRAFLEWAYPIMKGSARFYLDMLIEEPSHKWLVTAPANSPENAFRMADGTVAHICLGPSFDNQIIRALFDATREAAAVLGVDEALQEELAVKGARLPPTRIGSDGRIMEWLEEYEDVEPHHRHVSHLWGLYPGSEISARSTPELAEAARKTLDARGDGGTGWSLAHKLVLWARLGDGKRASDLLRSLLTPAGQIEGITFHGGGTYANLFDAHPPFQIDGNFGGTAAIAEMLVQSSPAQGDLPAEIVLLPALPPVWKEGEVRGVRARGGFEVDITWRDGALESASIRGEPGERVSVQTSGGALEREIPVSGSILITGQPTIFIAGDSTAAHYGDGPLQGWGVLFARLLESSLVKVDNRAIAGRSSRTFITSGAWDELIADVRPGDFVLIQFGQNDGGAINEEPPGSTRPLRARGTLPGLGDESAGIDNAVTKKHEIVRTFGWYMRKMIADVRERGATPIVFSQTIHNTWRDGTVMRGPGRFRDWSREIARAEGVAFVDHSRLIADEYQRLGEEAVRALFPTDHVHTGPAGAELNASLAIAGLAGLRGVDFKRLLSDEGRAIAPDSIGWLNLPEPADPALPSVFLIGDSTVRNGGGDGAGGQWGWGEPLAKLFDPACVNIVNRAIGGHTGRTFQTQGHWERALTLMKPGDFVVIQFGTNDGGPINDDSRARGSLPGTGEETEEIDNMLTKQHEIVHTNGWYLRRFVRDARAAGVTPVLCSLVPRKIWKDGKVVRSVNSSAAWAREVAEQERVAFLDLNEWIAARYDRLGAEKVDALFADAHTHTSWAGAELNAAIITEALRQLDGFPCVESVAAP